MKLALILQLVLLVYHQIFTLFDFYPFNGARFSKPAERIGEAAFNGLLMAATPIGLLFQVTPIIRFGAPFYFILFACEIATWFVPYVFGASPKWQDIYSRVQARTLMVLPRGDNPTPNLEHLILMGLTIAAALVTQSAYGHLPGSTPANPWIIAAVGIFMVSGIALTHWKRPARG